MASAPKLRTRKVMAAQSPGDVDIVYCLRHPRQETALRCGRCGDPICSYCVVHTDTGIRCPGCAGWQRNSGANGGGSPSREPSRSRKLTSILRTVITLVAVASALGLLVAFLGQSAARMDAETEARQAQAARAAAEENVARERQNRLNAEQHAQQEAQLRATAEAVARQEQEARLEAETAQSEAERARDSTEQDLINETTLRMEALGRLDRQMELRFETEGQLQEAQMRLDDAEAMIGQLQADFEQEQLLRESTEEDLEIQKLTHELLLATLLAANSPILQAIATKDLRIYIEDVPNYAADGVQDAVDDIIDILEDWEPYGARIRETRREENADIYVTWVRDYGQHIVGLAVGQRVIHIGLGSTNCQDEWQAFDPNTVTKILWHELGHAFGHGPSNDRDNIMYSETDTRFTVESDFSEVLPAGWYFIQPLCESGKYWFRFEADEADQGFELAVLPRRVSIEDYHANSASAYDDCGQGTWHWIADTCRVSQGARIYIYNYNLYEAVRIDGQIIWQDEPDWPDMEWDKDVFEYDDETIDYYIDLFSE